MLASSQRPTSRRTPRHVRSMLMVIWIVGLSGSGKSALARALRDSWPRDRGRAILIDGDEVRSAFRSSHQRDDHSLSGRRANAERVRGIVRLLDAQKFDVVVAVLSIFPDLLEENRLTLTHYREIYLKASLALVRRRDPRGIYAARDAGTQSDVVGIDIAFPEPAKPDMIVNMDGERRSASEIAADIITCFVL